MGEDFNVFFTDKITHKHDHTGMRVLAQESKDLIVIVSSKIINIGPDIYWQICLEYAYMQSSFLAHCVLPTAKKFILNFRVTRDVKSISSLVLHQKKSAIGNFIQ